MATDAGGDPGVPSDRDGLMQARIRALASLQTACSPSRRAMLEQTVADLDCRLGALATSASSDGPTSIP